MIDWQEDLLDLATASSDADEVFAAVRRSARALDFEFVAYGVRWPFPLANPAVKMLNNYPSRWQARYAEAKYLLVDPTVVHCLKSNRPLVWSDAVFARVPQMWEDANSFGICFGWSQSSFDASGVGGMLSLARSSGPLVEAELDRNELKMRWLVQMSHTLLSRCLRPGSDKVATERLTPRELEVLKWSADGKTCGEISDILSLSENTVTFHVKNAVAKLGTANKTSAVVRAAMLGLLA